MKNLPYKTLRKLAVPIGMLVLLIVLVIFGGRFLLGQIGGLRSDLFTVRDQEAKLARKTALLKEFALSGEKTADSLSVAVPRENPSVFAISQVRQIASLSGLFVSNLNVGKGVSEGDISHTDINFDVEGSLGSTFGFLAELVGSAPLGSVNRISLTRGGDKTTSTVVYRVYYSSFPQVIPPVSQELKEFTPEDNEIINKLVNLVPPSLIEVSPQTPSFNSNPFGL
jgi:hypothetical protein